jgi:5'-deoxynucleotidase YfbR-like HD superfamily hydrolase
MSETLRRIVQIRAGGAVERCHGIRHVGSYNNAMHQWGVAMLMRTLWPRDFPRLVALCLTHDVPEAWVGDMPATTKKFAPGVKNAMDLLEDRICVDLGLPLEVGLSHLDRRKLKCCDSLELYIWCIEQKMLGNQFAQEVASQLESFFEKSPLLPEAHELYMELRLDKLAVRPKIAGVIESLCETQEVTAA